MPLDSCFSQSIHSFMPQILSKDPRGPALGQKLGIQWGTEAAWSMGHMDRKQSSTCNYNRCNTEWTWRKSGRKKYDFYEQEKNPNFPPNISYENFQHTTKLKEFYSDYSYTCHLDSTINILPNLYIPMAFHPFAFSLRTLYIFER